MPRMQKYTDSEKVRIVDEYIVNINHGKADKIMYTKVANYAATLGYDGLKEYDFRRCEIVLKHIEDIRQGKVILENVPMPDYDPMDMDRYLSNISYSPSVMAEKMKEMNETCKRYSVEMLRQREECSRVCRRLESLEQETALLRIQLKQKEEELENGQSQARPDGDCVSKKEYDLLLKKLQSYSRLSRKFFNKDLAIHLVKENGDSCVEEYSVVDPDWLLSLFEGKKPEPLSHRETTGTDIPQETGGNADTVHSLMESLKEMTDEACRRD